MSSYPSLVPCKHKEVHVPPLDIQAAVAQGKLDPTFGAESVDPVTLLRRYLTNSDAHESKSVARLSTRSNRYEMVQILAQQNVFFPTEGMAHVHYLIHWAGYSIQEATWEPLCHVPGRAIGEYNQLGNIYKADYDALMAYLDR